MIRSSRLARTLAISTATALHGAAIWGLAAENRIETEGSAGAVETSIGSSFAEMAAGAIRPAQTQEIIKQVQPDAIDDTAPEEMIQPVQAARQLPPEPMRDVLLPLAQPPQKEALEPLARHPAKPEMAEATRPDDDPAPPVARSLRPRSRSAGVEKPPEPPKKAARPGPEKTRSQPRGNAARNAAAGTETAKTKDAPVAAGTGASRKKATGNAAASNYPGKVMRKISRVPKPRVGSKGTSVVAFTISPGGGLSAISLARSSGSSRLDQAALRVVRRAAPFPPPPAGARRRFSINIKGG